MGNYQSHSQVLDEEIVATYAELTYLRKNEIRHIAKLLDNIDLGKLRENRQHRFTTKQIEAVLPNIRCSPFCDVIYRIFSSKKDGHLSLEDVLDLCSVFSDECPEDVRAAWAFHIFDFDNDNKISCDDLIETISRLVQKDKDETESTDKEEIKHVAQMVLEEVVFNAQGSISPEEFIHFSARFTEFTTSFHFKV